MTNMRYALTPLRGHRLPVTALALSAGWKISNLEEPPATEEYEGLAGSVDATPTLRISQIKVSMMVMMMIDDKDYCPRDTPTYVTLWCYC